MYRKYIKRLLDIIFSFILILILWPLMIVVGIITFLSLGFPLFNYRREREGKNKKTYIMYKFRTKYKDQQGCTDHDKYNNVSRVIDKLRLNEILQLFNILKGDMSFVGPRPFIPGDKLPPGDISPKRYMVRPGVTGLSQINGGRFLSHKEKLKYDEIYYDNLSFMLDLKIILMTPIAIIKQSKKPINV